MSEESLAPYVLHNTKSHRAVIFCEGEISLVEVDPDGVIPNPRPSPQGLHLGMWLQPACAREVGEIGEAPEYLPLKCLMRHQWRLDRLTFSMVCALDAEIVSAELRRESAADLEEQMAAIEATKALECPSPEQLADQWALEEFRRIVLRTPLPNEAHTDAITSCGEHTRALFQDPIRLRDARRS